MRRSLILPIMLLFASFSSKGQTFWTENFTGGSTGLHVGSYTGVNGAWSNNTLGAEGAAPNVWYVSCTEAGKSTGTCGAPCVSGDFGESLHVGSDPFVSGDAGAAYFTGGCTTYPTYYGYSTYTYGTCAATFRRAESPVINCTGKTGITLSYYYIENGQGASDNGTVSYYDGSGWSLLEDPPKSTLCGVNEAKWAKRTIALPSSANNNPNVKIGFTWINDEDGLGSDPSFAVDSVSLSTVAVAPVASFTSTPTTVCQDSCITFTSTSTGSIDSIRWVLVTSGGLLNLTNVNPFKLCFPATYMPAGSYTIRLRAYTGLLADSSSVGIVINTAPHPAITRTGHVLAAVGTHTSYQWSNSAGPITGATSSTYTFTIGGVYSVVVDSGGCKGTGSITVSTVAVPDLNEVAGNYWISQPDKNTIVVNASEVAADPLTISVYDAAGRQIINDVLTAGSKSRVLNSSALAPALYTVRLGDSKTSQVLKFVKQ